jgi:adiponectin receptor
MFGSSTLYHLLFCVGPKWSAFLLRVDYSGICALAAGGTIPAIHYGFYCDHSIMHFYITMVLVMSTFVYILSLMDFMHDEKFVVWKSLIYATFFFVNLIPVIHLVFFE